MGKFFTKTIATALAVLFAAYLLDGVTVNNTLTALFVAAVLGLLNNFVKPLLIILTIPITLFTLGLFLLFINIIIIKMAAEIVPGFTVNTWWSALLFSFIVSIITAFIEGFIGKPEQREDD